MKKETSKKATFKVRLLQIFVTLIFLQGISTVFTFFYLSKSMVFNLSNKFTNEIVEKTQERVTNYLSTPASLTKITSPLVNTSDIIDGHEGLWKYMWNPLIMTPQLESFFIADLNGSYVQVRRTPYLATRHIDRNQEIAIDKRLYRDENYLVVNVTEKETSFDPRVRPWFTNISENETIEEKYHWTDAYIGTTSQKPVIGCAYPVMNSPEELGAVVCVNIPLENLSSFLSEQKITDNSSVFIIDSMDQIIAFPDFSEVVMKKEGEKSTRLRTMGEITLPHLKEAYNYSVINSSNDFVLEQEDDNYIISIKDIPSELGLNWRVVTSIPESELLSDVYSIIQKIMIVFAIIFTISILAIIFVSGRITRSIELLSHKNEKLQNFDLDLGEKVESNIREISRMSDSLYNAAAGLNAFKKYVPSDLVRNLISTGQEATVGGVPKNLTIFFSDIAGFTNISEKIASDYLMQHLSEYFDNLSSIIMAENGTIDKYIGDSIMAFWGAPLENQNSEIDACNAALACQKVLKSLNKRWEKLNKPVMRTRIGIASGDVVVGNVGSNERINYSVIGDSVNLASRLESINKYYGTQIIISWDVYNKVKDLFHCRFLDTVAVMGKTDGIKIYELVAPINNKLTMEQKKFHNWYEKGMDHYLNKEWDEALKYFGGIKKKIKISDESVNLFIKRCLHFKSNIQDIPKDWDGVARFTTK